MGYQESYLTASTEKRFNKILNRIRELGYDYYESYGTIPVEIITFNKGNEWFKKGQKAIYFVGERYLQREPLLILRYATDDDFCDMDIDNDYDACIKWKKEFEEGEKYHAEIILTEYVDAEGIWEDAGKPLYVTHEKFTW
jgi:hypothetical protein